MGNNESSSPLMGRSPIGTAFKKINIKRLEEVPMTPLSPKFHSDASYDFFTQKEGVQLSGEKNFGFLPTAVVHRIMTFLEPRDFLSSFQTCRLVYNMLSIDKFWKMYFSYYFEEKLPEVDPKDNLNWKLRFFNRYTQLSDEQYRRKFFQPVRKEDLPPNRPFDTEGGNEIKLLVVGSNQYNSGKESFTRSILSDFDHVGNPPKFIVSSREFMRREDRKFNNRVVLREYSEKGEYLKDKGFYEPMYGLFLCFSVNDRNSFFDLQKIYTQIQLKTEENETVISLHSLCLLVGIDDEKKKKDDDDDDDDDKKKKRKVGYKEGMEFAVKNKFLGYVECEASSFRSRNVFLSFGVLLEGMIRRKRKRRKHEKDGCQKTMENIMTVAREINPFQNGGDYFMGGDYLKSEDVDDL